MPVDTIELSSSLPGSRRAWGRRRMTPDALAGDILARRFDGLPEGVAKPHELLSALKKARAQLGIPGEVVDLIDALFAFTEPQDWLPGARPVVWPSNGLLAHGLGVTVSALKKRVRRALDLRLLSDKPSPNGKRFGVRVGGRHGHIALEQSFGFDLSLLALRHAEIAAAASRGADLYKAGRALQRRGYAAKTGLLQLIETATDHGLWTRYWEELETATRAHCPALATIDQPARLAHAVHALEGLRQEAEGVLSKALSNPTESVENVGESHPKGGAEAPQYNYTDHLSNLKNTDRGLRGSSQIGGAPCPLPEAEPPTEELRFSAAVLLDAAPEIGGYCRSANPGWDELAESARLTCQQLDISHRLWGRACQVLGRHMATLALAVMLHQAGRKPISSPGGYFHNMIARAEKGELDLRRSYYGMRSRLTPLQ